MEQILSLPELIDFLQTQNIKLDSRQTEQLEIYYKELFKWSSRINLISSGDKKFLVERHFIPSFYYAYYLSPLNQNVNTTILDLGSGAGFPGIILAILKNDGSVTLLDSSRKKALFLKQVAEKLNLRINIECERVETLSEAQEQKYNIIVARAVASIPQLFEWCKPLLDTAGFLMTLKGENYRQEIKPAFKMDLTPLDPSPEWIKLSKHLSNKRMIRISIP